MATDLLTELRTHAGAEPAYSVDGNEVFVCLPKAAAETLQSAGVGFYPWPGGLYRFVASWTTQEHELAAIARAFN